MTALGCECDRRSPSLPSVAFCPLFGLETTLYANRMTRRVFF
jgi:hypothetical protein